MIGQVKLRKYFNDLINVNKLRNFYILCAPNGYGKTTLVEYVSELLWCPCVKINSPTMEDIRGLKKTCGSLPTTTVFTVDSGDYMSIQCQNALLKLLEDTPRHAIIFLELENISNALPTVVSRGVQLHLERYTRKELAKLTDNSSILEMASSPGEVEEFLKYKDTVAFADKVYNNLTQITAANVFNIGNHVQLKENGDGFNLDVLMSVLMRKFKGNIEALTILYDHKKQFHNNSINKRNSFDVMMIKLRRVLLDE